MKTFIKNISLLLCAAVALASCERRPIYAEFPYSTTLAIPIDIDWETSGITLQNVTILFYDSNDGSLQYEHKYEQNSKDIQSYAYLPTGSYTAVIFNELRDQIDYLSCAGYNNISTLRFESIDDTPLRTRNATRSYVKQSGDLAVAVVEGIVVTDEMILEASNSSDDSSTKALSTSTKATVESLMGVTTVKKNMTLTISAHFDNIYYARMPALVDLSNLADGYYPYRDKNSSATSTLQFTMNNRSYDYASVYNGTISTTVTTFGTLNDRTSTSGHDNYPITMDVLFQLIDSGYTEENHILDVTDIIVHTVQSDSSITLDINATFPDAISAVATDAVDGDSGFGSDLNEWDRVDVDVAL